MTREEVILAHIKRDGVGLEIGAGCSPIAPKKQGVRVHVLDHCDKKALIEKYRPHGIAVANIEEVDFGWDGRPYGAGKTGNPRRERARDLPLCP